MLESINCSTAETSTVSILEVSNLVSTGQSIRSLPPVFLLSSGFSCLSSGFPCLSPCLSDSFAFSAAFFAASLSCSAFFLSASWSALTWLTLSLAPSTLSLASLDLPSSFPEKFSSASDFLNASSLTADFAAVFIDSSCAFASVSSSFFASF